MRLRSFVVLTALMILVPTRAYADRSWWAWLEELSGPGWFGGPMYSKPLRCWDADRQKVRCLPGVDKDGRQPKDIKSSLHLTVGWLSSYHRPRFDNVGGSPESNENTRPVYVVPLHATYAYRPGRAWEFGTGGGVMFFYGDEVHSHVRPIWTPVTVTWRFLLRGDHPNTFQRGVALEGQTYYIFPGFNGTSFSSTDNGFSSPPELKGSIGVSFSFGQR
jgi:hypothetical protein